VSRRRFPRNFFATRLPLPRLVGIVFSGPIGAILLSSMVWTALHLQYDWFFFPAKVFSIGLLLGYLRLSASTRPWLTVVVHGLNNSAALVQTMWIAGSG